MKQTYDEKAIAVSTPTMTPLAASPFPIAPVAAIGEKRVTFHHLDWQAYQQILHALPQTRATRLTDDRGILEVTTPLEDHEFAVRLIERLIDCLIAEMGMKIKTMGSTTLEREDLDRSAEPRRYDFLAQAAQDEVDAEQALRLWVRQQMPQPS